MLGGDINVMLCDWNLNWNWNWNWKGRWNTHLQVCHSFHNDVSFYQVSGFSLNGV